MMDDVQRVYRLEISPDDNGTLLVTCPELPEVTTFADDRDQAEIVGTDAVEEALAARISRGEDVPVGSGVMIAGRSYARLGLMSFAKVSLYRVAKRDGVTRAELARRLNWHREQVDRLFRLDHASRADQIEAALAALGYNVDLSVQPMRDGPASRTNSESAASAAN